VRKVEQQVEAAKKKTQEFAAVTAQAGSVAGSTFAAISKASGAAGFSLKEMGNGLREMAKGQAMLALRQGVMEASSAVKQLGVDVDGTTASIGMMIGGLKGAAIGAGLEGAYRIGKAGGEAFADMITGDTDAIRAARSEIIAYGEKLKELDTLWGMATTKLEAHRAGIDAVIAARERDNSLAHIGGANKLLAEQTTKYQELKDAVTAHTFALIRLDEQNLKGARAAQERLELEQNLRDAMIRKTMADQGHGQAVADIRIKELQRIDSTIEMNKALFAGVINEKEHAAALGLTIEKLDKATSSARAYGQTISRWNPKDSNSWARRGDIEGVDAISGGAAPILESQTNGFKAQVPTDVPVPAAIDESIAAIEKLNEKATKLGDIMSEQVVGSARQFSSLLVDAANGADVSWRGFVDGLLVGIQKAIAQALILKAITGDYGGAKGAGGYGGLLGLLGGATGLDYLATAGKNAPGFATGGDIYTRGAGSTDSMLAMLRITPGESLHVRTPEQRREAAREAGAGQQVKIVNQMHDPRALPPSDRSILNVLNKYRGAVRALVS
jgi:hypothetical protein